MNRLLDTLEPKTARARALAAAADAAAAEAFAAGTAGAPLTAETLEAGLVLADNPFDAASSAVRRASVCATLMNRPDYAELRRSGRIDDGADAALCGAVADDPEFLTTGGRGTLSRYLVSPEATEYLFSLSGVDPALADAMPFLERGRGSGSRPRRADAADSAALAWASVPRDRRAALVSNAVSYGIMLDAAGDMLSSAKKGASVFGAAVESAAAMQNPNPAVPVQRKLLDWYS